MRPNGLIRIQVSIGVTARFRNAKQARDTRHRLQASGHCRTSCGGSQMARVTETEVVDLQETVQQETIREDHSSSDQGDTEKQEFKRNKPRMKLSRWILLFVSGLAVVGVTSWWLVSRNYESTDDAQIEGHLDLVSARINGTVSYINPQVENNQFIKAGTLLLELDPRDYQAELEHAQANLDTRNAEARSALVNVPIVNAS